MTKAVIHIGSHKTGSTAIQRALIANAALLQENDYIYPNIAFSYYGHHRLAELLSDAVPSEIEKQIRQFDNNIILSSENFSTLGDAAVSRLGKLMDNRNALVVSYQRNPLELPYVWWQELVKHGSKITFPCFCTLTLLNPSSFYLFSPTAVFERWSKVFGNENLNMYIYDTLDAPQHFIKTVLEIEANNLPALKHINKSFDPYSAECMRFLNQNGLSGLPILQDDAVKRFLRQNADLLQSYTEGFDFSFDCPLFRSIEEALAHNWFNVSFKADKTTIFERRRHTTKYLDGRFWLEEPAFVQELLALAAAVCKSAS